VGGGCWSDVVIVITTLLNSHMAADCNNIHTATLHSVGLPGKQRNKDVDQGDKVEKGDEPCTKTEVTHCSDWQEEATEERATIA